MSHNQQQNTKTHTHTQRCSFELENIKTHTCVKRANQLKKSKPSRLEDNRQKTTLKIVRCADEKKILLTAHNPTFCIHCLFPQPPPPPSNP